MRVNQKKAMPNVPDDIVDEILSRLPVKTLVLFKCVCKSWKTLMTHPSFIRVHLKRSKPLNLFLTQNSYHSGGRDPGICSVDQIPPKKFMNIGFCDPDGTKFLVLLGSCNGLLCLYVFYPPEQPLILCNPSTMEYRTLPNSARRNRSTFSYGFGGAMNAGDNIDDYKVVKIDERSMEVEVYSLRRDSWTWIRDAIPSGLSIPLSDQVMLNGSLHWLVGKEFYIQSILSFDMADEVFREIMLPADIVGEELGYVTLLEGRLSVFGNVTMEALEVWVMKEYGVVESWTRQYVIRHYPDFDGRISYRPLGFTGRGEVLLHRRNGFLLYDLRSKIAEYFEMNENIILSEVFTYVQSFVSVMPGEM